MPPLRVISSVILACVFSLPMFAQGSKVPESSFATTRPFELITVPPSLSPELALAAYQRAAELQSSELAGYTATSVIDAELPESSQKAEFELKRHYAAPSVLEFTPLRWTGDQFVKSNIIVRLLESEADHIHRQEQPQPAIDSRNYKFSYKGISQLNGIPVHVFEVKPHHKRVGLFKGKIYLDTATGHLLRAQGTIAKTPSFFIKKIRFTQDYTIVAGFTLPTHLHSEADTRLVGKAIVDVIHRDYQPQTALGDNSEQSSVALTGATH